MDLKDYCETKPDASYLCPLLGHCSFTTAAILLAFQTFHKGNELHDYIPEIKETDSIIQMVHFIVATLRELSMYWKVLRRPVS